MGGGNLAILDALAQHNRRVGVYIGHDLDRDNRAMVSDRRIDFVLHHDLRVDMSNVFASFLGHHRIKVPPQQPISTVQIITPENVPPI
jgi:LacI family transcriptional regulator